MSIVSRTMVEVKTIDKDILSYVEDFPIELVAGGYAFAVTKTENRDSLNSMDAGLLVYVAEDSKTGFIACGTGKLDGKNADVYYIGGNGLRRPGVDKLYIMDKVIDDCLAEAIKEATVLEGLQNRLKTDKEFKAWLREEWRALYVDITLGTNKYPGWYYRIDQEYTEHRNSL